MCVFTKDGELCLRKAKLGETLMEIEVELTCKSMNFIFFVFNPLKRLRVASCGGPGLSPPNSPFSPPLTPLKGSP